jgi:hypothetical protein
MAAITGIVWVKTVPFMGAHAGGLLMEVWKVPASSDGDTQTLALPDISNVLAVVGPACAVVPNVTSHALDVITTSTIDASNMSHLLIIGTA